MHSFDIKVLSHLSQLILSFSFRFLVSDSIGATSSMKSTHFMARSLLVLQPLDLSRQISNNSSVVMILILFTYLSHIYRQRESVLVDLLSVCPPRRVMERPSDSWILRPNFPRENYQNFTEKPGGTPSGRYC